MRSQKQKNWVEILSVSFLLTFLFQKPEIALILYIVAVYMLLVYKTFLMSTSTIQRLKFKHVMTQRNPTIQMASVAKRFRECHKIERIMSRNTTPILLACIIYISIFYYPLICS